MSRPWFYLFLSAVLTPLAPAFFLNKRVPGLVFWRRACCWVQPYWVCIIVNSSDDWLWLWSWPGYGSSCSTSWRATYVIGLLPRPGVDAVLDQWMIQKMDRRGGAPCVLFVSLDSFFKLSDAFGEDFGVIAPAACC